jgi:hypothetical protein
MKWFKKSPDGGTNSGVTAYFLIEWKSLFSVAILRFNKDSDRENFHSHAFNAITWWLKGHVVEEDIDGGTLTFKPSIWPKITKREKVHKVHPVETTWAITFRGPWNPHWIEVSPTGEHITLGYGRKIIHDSQSNTTN